MPDDLWKRELKNIDQFPFSPWGVVRQLLEEQPLVRPKRPQRELGRTIAVLLYEADKLAYEQLRRLRGLPVPDPEKAFVEQENTRVIRDLSNVEELELLLAMSKSMLRLFTASAQRTDDELASLIKAEGERLRANFIVQHGYAPEESATPYIPVTIDGPQDHGEYYAKEYPDS